MDRFNICQGWLQLEHDYNVGGILQERPSNQRRRESIGVQLHRMGYSNPYGWVNICDLTEDDMDACEVREVYMCAVLRLGLNIDDELRAAMREFFGPEFLSRYPQFQGETQ